MPLLRRLARSAWLLCLPALIATAGAGRAADDAPPLDAKAVDATVYKTLREVINEGADMYNAQGKYANMERNYAGCYYLYQGALIATRPLLSGRPELQKEIDDGLDNARNTPEVARRAFVLRDVIDKVRDAVKPEKTAVTPPPTEAPKPVTGKVAKSAGGKITINSKDYSVPDAAKVMIDCKEAKAADIKADSTATITFDKEGNVASVDVKAAAVAPPPPPKETTLKGKAISAEKGKLTATVDEKEKTFTVPEDAKVMIDGKDGKVEEIKKDSTVTVTLKGDVVTKVDVKAPAAPPPPPPAETTVKGVVTKADKEKVTIKGQDDKETTVTIPDDAKVTIDGKEGKAADIKEDSVVTVTRKGDAVTKVDVKSPTPPPPPPVKEKTTKGTVTKNDKGKLTVKDDAGKESTVVVPLNAKVTIEGKPGEAEDIKADSTVTITEKDGAIIEVAAKAAAAPPPPPPPPPAAEKTTTGKVVKVDAEKMAVTVKDAAGKETAYMLDKDAKVTIDGKEGKAEEIKTDSTATVTTKDGKVTKIEVKGSAVPPPPPAETLWDRLGGEANVAKVVDDFVNTAGKDPKVNFWRDPTAVPSKEQVGELKKRLVEFVSSATGGPLKYTGKDMKDAHKGMKITDEEFDAAAADLKAALEKNGAKADDVKAVMAAVESTRKDIVEAKAPEDKPKPPEEKKPEDKKPEEKPAETGSVSGKVQYKGVPMTGGSVHLVAADGKEATGAIAADGMYNLEGVKAGEYTVAVDPTQPNAAAAAIPKKYADPKTSSLKITVQKGKNVFDIDLVD